MSRTINTTRNILWGFLGNLINTLLGLVSRTVFINILGTEYLGVNGLFTNILSVLSFAELGIGTAINYSLYKPIAENDVEKIKSLMQFYKRAYCIIALIVGLLGLILLPFLNYLINGGEGITDIPVIYLIFLFNTTYSYLFTYKRTLLSADQKTYLLTNITMIINVFTLCVQLGALYYFENYIFYLLAGTVIGILQNIYINRYIDKRYSFLLDKEYTNLSKDELSAIIKNIKAMMLHKVGDLSINQTDNIIISSFINIVTVGLVSNYTLVINTVNIFIMNVFNSATASLGNLVASESDENKLEVFKVYNFVAFWFFGIAVICFYNLLNPFITIWIGVYNVIEQPVLNLILLNYYLVGMRVPLGNIKTAAGIYSQDKYIPIIQSIINLFFSLLLVKYWGLAGVFAGTLISSITTVSWYRPIIVYRYVFNRPVKRYFIKFGVYATFVLTNILLTSFICDLFFLKSTIENLIMRTLTCLIVPNVFFIIMFCKTAEFIRISKLIKKTLCMVGEKMWIKKSAL